MDKSPIALLPFRFLRILPASKERHEPIDDFIRRTPGSLVTLRALERAGAIENTPAAPARPGSGAARCSATACSFNSPMRSWTISMTWRRPPNGATRRTPDVATEGPALARRRGAGGTTGAQGHLLPPFSTGQVAAWWIRRGPCPPVGATLTEGERYGQESRTRAAHASH